MHTQRNARHTLWPCQLLALGLGKLVARWSAPSASWSPVTKSCSWITLALDLMEFDVEANANARHDFVFDRWLYHPKSLGRQPYFLYHRLQDPVRQGSLEHDDLPPCAGLCTVST